MGHRPEPHKTWSRVFSNSKSNDTSSLHDQSTTYKSNAVILDDETHGVLGLTTLHEPTPPASIVADIIFVHGLGGGSRKTWSYSPDRDHYWPKAWLASDLDFADMRIHSFGYKSDWAERQQSILDIRDFAASLVGELKNNPGIRRSNTRIIFVCHSMGGCVAKKAYIQTRQDPTCKALADRIHSFFFLGTPHRGSDLAAILKRLSLIAWGSKPFVSDLVPESSALRDINDTFRHYAPDLHLWSFYETIPVKPRLLNKIVVERHSATLGYPDEEIIAMNADHRELCKFNHPSDPNYKLLRNALHTAVDMIRSFPASDPVPSQIDSNPENASQRLRSFLGIVDTPEDDLQNLQLLQESGSCRWFSESERFISWKSDGSPEILWLTGRPGSGKSVISSHIVEQLQSQGARCSYFFFRQREANKSTLSDCLRSLAFQMAMQDGQVAGKLLQLEDQSVTWDMSDELILWRRLFISEIFKLPSIFLQHFWVIDGIDECINFNSLFTKKILVTLPKGLRLFAASRHLEEIRRGLASLGSRVSLHSLSEADTLDDMQLFVASRLRELDRLEDDESIGAMCDNILVKSSGSFLWVRLVLQEFENAWTSEAMDAILDEVPMDLQDMYRRMLQSMENGSRGVKLARSILMWTVLACRPLTIEELRMAVKLDVGETLQSMSKAIPSLCHQLVFVDNTDRIHVLHATVREFLLDETLHSEFAIRGMKKHAYLGSLLLRYLTTTTFKLQAPPSRSRAGFRGFARPALSVSNELSLLDYAACFFSEHVHRGTSEDDDLMAELCAFLKGKTFFSWIEYTAKNGSLADIAKTAINLRGYLGQRIKYLPPEDPSVNLVDCWVTDMIYVAAKFRSQLLACPSSIHYIIPSLCPSDSIISKTFANSLRPSSMTVRGIPPATWDDCLTRIDFDRGMTTALSYDTKFLSIGLSTGHISLYDPHSYLRAAEFTHPERVRMLGLSNDGGYIASSGARTLIVWHLRSGAQRLSFPLQSQLVAFTFLNRDEFLCAFASGELTKWSLDSGEHETISWRNVEDAIGTLNIPEQPPNRAAFLTTGETVLLAVGYRNLPIFIWDVLELRLLGQCEAGDHNGIDDMAFNPNPEITALAVSFGDGRLCLFDYITLALTSNIPSAFANSIAWSSDGRNLVTGSSMGTIEVFEFDQDYAGNVVLVLIYRIQTLDDSIRSVAFSADGVRFVDIHDKQCRVWEPAALMRKYNELKSIRDTAQLPPKTVSVLEDSEGLEITSPLAVPSNGGRVVAGKSNGDVVVFSAVDGKELGVLYGHGRGVSIVNIALGEARNLVVSADDGGRVFVVELSIPFSAFSKTPERLVSRVILNHGFGAAIVGLLVNHSADRLLISGRNTEQLYDLSSGQVLNTVSHNICNASSIDLSQHISSSGPNTSLTKAVALQHPTNEAWIVLMHANAAQIFRWADLQELTTTNSAIFQKPSAPVEAPFSPSKIWTTKTPFARNSSYHVGQGFVLELLGTSPSAAPRLYIWPASTFDPEITRPEGQIQHPTEVDLSSINVDILDVLGIIGQSTIILIDVNLWIYSLELRPAQTTPHTHVGTSETASQSTQPAVVRRHFFALSEWRTIDGYLRCAVTQRSSSPDFFFAYRHYVIVVQGGFEYSELMFDGERIPQK